MVSKIVSAAYRSLDLKGVGIHATEIIPILAEAGLPVNIETIDPMLIMTLVLRDERIKLARGQFIYLEEWQDSRRLNLWQAARKVAEETAHQALAVEEIEQRISTMLKRPVLRPALSACLGDIGAVYSAATGLWSFPKSSSSDDLEFHQA